MCITELQVMYNKSNKVQARTYMQEKALSVKPSFGKAYLLIAQLYGGNINDCGATQFEKRAVYWLVAQYCDKAGQLDSSIKGISKTKQLQTIEPLHLLKEIFQKERSWTTELLLTVGLEKVVVPNIGK